MNVLDWSMHVWRYIRATAPRVGPGLQSTETPSGTIISLAPKQAGTAAALLPFQITASAAALKAAPGTIENDRHPPDGTAYEASDLVHEFSSAPADGDWYLEANATISSTGLVTATGVEWVDTISTDTTTKFHTILGTVTFEDGVATVLQPNYGPLGVIVHGGVDNKFKILFL